MKTQNSNEKRIKFINKIQVEYSLVSVLFLFFVGVMLVLLFTNSFDDVQQKNLVAWIVIPVLIIFVIMFAFLAISYCRIKRELKVIKGQSTQTKQVDILKIKVRQYPVGRFIYAVSCLEVCYRFNDTPCKGYYIPEEHVYPHAVKKQIKNAKLSLYKDSRIIDEIDKEIFSEVYGIKRDLV